MENLRVAVQKSGRLSEESLALLKKCGLKLHIDKRKLLCRDSNMNIDILLVRDDDIPYFVAGKICDLGIVGKNIVAEHKDISNVVVKKELGFSKCRLSISTPKNQEKTSLKQLQNSRIATSYPNILQDFLAKKNITAQIINMKGSVEVAPQLNIANAICDLVSTGSTLEANSLIELTTIFNSQAVLIANKDSCSEQKVELINKLLSRIEGIINARENKYIMFNAPKDQLENILQILPKNDSPTIIPLSDMARVAVHIVCREEFFWDTMEQLKLAGATSIVVSPIEKILV